ncbi:homocysteine S-methyltransferase family protein [Parasaccharibacter sp. TMW 2.1891]|uniref:homocysteine S-methyltransferase family protein n=1 Tax=Parasaccharibacter sp. TMW 2.1891 TaxID=2267836 RepID=UPI002011FD3A|nr:homocysteine S-methyltransferase family protein [Parasaccharibacter sp. TMW 2.1891]MCL1512938.1 homocysteine S-methyltransferase family protein [Parasaccharibacter sp. TMW 2.1891]
MPSSTTPFSSVADRTPLILDGGMGRELHRMGAPFRQPEWSALSLIERPDLVQQAHENFLKAGAHVITTNSYAVVPFHIGEERFAARGEELARLSGHLGRQAIAAQAQGGKPSLLAGSLPPAGGSYRPDLFTPQKAKAILTPLIRGLAPSADLWLAETQSSIAELQTAHRLVQQSTDDARPFWGSFTLDDSDPAALIHQHAPVRLRSGELLEEAVEAALQLKLEALLFNCSDPRIMETALHTARKVLKTHGDSTTLKLGVYANGFAHNHHDGEGEGANESITPLDGTLTSQRYADFAQHWLAAGADIIGGCCGIGPEHVAALAARFS